MARYRVMADAFAQRQVDAIERESQRPYTVLVIGPSREIANAQIPFLRWRLDLPEQDAEFLVGAYGYRPPGVTIADGIVFIHPARAESSDPGILAKSMRCLRRGGWKAYIGGNLPWNQAQDLLLSE